MSSVIENGFEDELKPYIDEGTGMQMALVNLHYYEVRNKKQLEGFQRKLEKERVMKKEGRIRPHVVVLFYKLDGEKEGGD